MNQQATTTTQTSPAIIINDKDCLPIDWLQVPKCVTPLDGKLYFVDITGQELREYDPKSRKDRVLKRPDLDGTEFTTALGVNEEDGSLIVACQSGIYYVKPAKAGLGDEWMLACELKLAGIETENKKIAGNERVNNGVMIPCSDGKTRFFLGTAAKDTDKHEITNGVGRLDPTEYIVDRQRPGRLLVMEEEGGKFTMHELAHGLMTVNALSGQQIGNNFTLTYADSYKDASLLRTATYRPKSKTLGDIDRLVDFKNNAGVADHGRTDGTSPVIYDNKHCVAVAAIGTNEVRVYSAEDGEQQADKPLFTFVLPPNLTPTMPTFTIEDGKKVCYITAFETTDKHQYGKIYRLHEDDYTEL